MNRTIHIIRTSRTAILLALMAMLAASEKPILDANDNTVKERIFENVPAATPCTASRSPTTHSPTATPRNDCQL